MYYYAHKDTKIFQPPSLVQLSDPNLIEVPTPPESGLSRWDEGSNSWLVLSESEIEQYFPDEDSIDNSLDQVVLPSKTTDGAIVLWDGTKGRSLKDSPLVFRNGTLNIEGNLNINGECLNKTKDEQKVIKTDRRYYSDTSWQQVPDLHLVTENSVASNYIVEVELLVKVSKNNRDFDFAIFINNEQQSDDTLSIDFNRANDDKTINWSDDFDLKPSSIVTVHWKRSGNYNSCEVGRRKLKIYQK